VARAAAVWEAKAAEAIAMAPPEAKAAIMAGSEEARRALVRYAPEVKVREGAVGVGWAVRDGL
jgi:hypothetical protein